MPEALVNFVALLGWGPSKNEALLEPTLKDDILSLKQMRKYVSLSCLQLKTCLVRIRRCCCFKCKTSRI